MTIRAADPGLQSDANFKERQLKGVQVGMPATADGGTSMAESITLYHGKVAGHRRRQNRRLDGADPGAKTPPVVTGSKVVPAPARPAIELDPKELAEPPALAASACSMEV